jgi:hypothetical protein
VLPEEARSDDPLQLVRRTIVALRNRAGERPVILAVDHTQLLDVASAGLLLHLATAASAFVVATLQPRITSLGWSQPGRHTPRHGPTGMPRRCSRPGS